MPLLYAHLWPRSASRCHVGFWKRLCLCWRAWHVLIMQPKDRTGERTQFFKGDSSLGISSWLGCGFHRTLKECLFFFSFPPPSFLFPQREQWSMVKVVMLTLKINEGLACMILQWLSLSGFDSEVGINKFICKLSVSSKQNLLPEVLRDQKRRPKVERQLIHV